MILGRILPFGIIVTIAGLIIRRVGIFPCIGFALLLRLPSSTAGTGDDRFNPTATSFNNGRRFVSYALTRLSSGTSDRRLRDNCPFFLIVIGRLAETGRFLATCRTTRAPLRPSRWGLFGRSRLIIGIASRT